MKVQKTSDPQQRSSEIHPRFVQVMMFGSSLHHPWTNISICWTSRLNVRAAVYYNRPSIMHVLVFCDAQGCSLPSLLQENWHSPVLWRHSHLSPALLFKDSYLNLQLTYRTRIQTESNTALLLFRHVSHTPSSRHKAVPHLKVVERSGSNGDKQMWCGTDKQTQTCLYPKVGRCKF